MQELDAYIDALRSMPNEVGEAVRAIDAAEERSLPPLEMTLAADAVRAARGGTSEQEWLRSKLHLADDPTVQGSHQSAPHRLGQAVASLMDAGLWPW